jgi:LysM repeat protein
MFGLSSRVSSVMALLVVGGLLVGCTSTPLNRAPVVDRGTAGVGLIAVPMDPNTPVVKQPPGFENAGKPGYYTVKPGDTMTRIGLETGQAAKDIARWSGVENPHKIEVGQVLRVVPPVMSSAMPAPTAAGASAAGATGVVTKPVAQASVTATGNAVALRQFKLVAGTTILPGSGRPAGALFLPALMRSRTKVWTLVGRSVIQSLLRPMVEWFMLVRVCVATAT